MNSSIKPKLRIALPFVIAFSLVASLITFAPSASAVGPPWYVTYQVNFGETGTPPLDTNAYANGAPVTVSTQPLAKVGYSFIGWNLCTSPGTIGSFPIYGDTALCARWDAIIYYHVTYSGNGESGGTAPSDSGNYLSGATVAVASNQNTLYKTGYTFGGWSMPTGMGPQIVTSFPIYANTTLLAVWNPITTFNVFYNGNCSNTCGSVPATATLSNGSAVNVGSAPTQNKPGYTFGGWATGGGAGPTATYQPGQQFTPPAGDVTLTAIWTAVPTYMVTYMGDQYSTGQPPIDTNKYLLGDPVTLKFSGTLVRGGYSLSGWMDCISSTVETNPFAIPGNIDLCPIWTSLTPHTATFFPNATGTTGSMSVETSNIPTALTANTFARTGYTFVNWNTDPSGGGIGTPYADQAQYLFGTDVLLYAQWSKNPLETVTFLANASGTTGTMSVETANVPTPLTTNAYARPGYTFVNWNTDPAGGGIGTPYADQFLYPFNATINLYAQWALIPTFKVTYDGNCSNSCGSVPIDGTAYSPNALVPVGVAPNANYPGFTFAGWANGGLAVYQPGGHFSITSNTILTAVWIKNVTYTVTYFPYQTSGGVQPVDLLNPYSSGDVVFVFPGPGTLFKTGYTFNGWGNCPAVTTVGTSFVIHNDTTLCSLWIINPKFKVTYNGNGNTGGSVPGQTIGSGIVTLATNTGSLVKSSYHFGGWNTKANGLGIPYAVGSNYNLIADVTLYAVWTPINSKYTITYDGNGNSGGSAPSPTTGAGSVTLAVNSGLLIKVGNHFGKWNTKADGTGISYLLGASYNLIADITLFAMWTPNTFTITYDGNGSTSGVVPNPTVGSGPVTLATNSGALAKSGNTYVGWNTATDGSGTSYSVGDPYTLSADITLYAVWLPTTYSVTYVGNGNTGGSVPVDITAYSSGGTVIVLGPNTLINAGYTFGGWALGGLVVYAPGATFTITTDTVLTAVWTPNIVYTITYLGNGNSGGSAPSPTIGSGLVNLATNSGALVQSGSTFGGWNTSSDGSGTAYAVGSPYTLNANITLYAVWMGGGMTNCTITYNGNGFTGGSVPNPTVGMGSVTLATNSGSLVRAGYTFGGWNTTADGSGIPYAVGSNYNLHVDITLYAVWHPIAIPVYTITYLGNGYTSGSEPAPTVGLGSVTLATNSGALGKSGSTFGGWNTTSDGSGTPYSVGSNYTLLANITLYAVWHPISVVYTITYLGNTNTGGVAPHPTIGAGSVNLAINSGPLVKSGSIFGGWNTSASGSGTPYAVGSGYTLLADINLYAVWSAGNPLYTITYSGNTNTGGVVPTPTVGSGSVTLAANSSPLVKSGFSFGGWNTKADGTGTSYSERSNYNLTANVTLYAVWSTYTIYTITYVGNGNSGGTVPGATQGSGLVVLAANTGSLAKSGSTFAGWNTKTDRSGTSYLASSNYNLTANLTLYAAYIPLAVSITLPDIIANGKIINTSPQKKIALNQIVPVHQKFLTVLPSNAVGFELYENGKLINRGTSSSVDLTQIVGPKDRVTVVTVSKLGLKSAPAPVSLAKEPISLANINFNTDSYKFIGPATKILDQVAAVIRQHGYTTLEIWGYVDTQGSKASWITLSNNRAKAVKDYMTKKLKGSGVLIKNAGRAQTQAVGNNNTAAGRALNRRVEIRVS